MNYVFKLYAAFLMLNASCEELCQRAQENLKGKIFLFKYIYYMAITRN